jgi:glycosyltransferase involved in cell wall biosynthesis
MHILILPSWYVNSLNNLSGIFFKEQAEGLAKYGNKVGVIAIQERSVIDMVKQRKIVLLSNKFVENDVITYSVQYPAIPKLHKLKQKLKIEIFKTQFKKYITENGLPEIVHLHSFMVGEFAIWIKENYGIPYVVTEHFSGFARNTISLKDLEKAKKIFEKSDCNIAVSKQFSLLLETKFNLRFEYVPNIVNIDFFELKEFRQKDSFTFINIAFLDKNKNQDMLIKSFTKAFSGELNVKLSIAGDGPEYNSLKNLIKELNMEHQISLYGRATRDEVKTLLQKSDAFVLSSQYETFGVVVIEAMACGLPVVATKCGGPESIIISDKLGILSNINEADFVESLKIVYENKNKYDSKFIREYIVENFSEESICNKLMKVYNAIVK